jgi:hypothetical protein
MYHFIYLLHQASFQQQQTASLVIERERAEREEKRAKALRKSIYLSILYLLAMDFFVNTIRIFLSTSYF